MTRMSSLSLIAALLIAFAVSTARADEITFIVGDSSMDIHIRGKHFATYVWKDPDIPRPYFKQVVSPNGHQVTRRYPTDPILNEGNDDHATYHPGIWLAFGDINGHDFWRNKARVRNVQFRSKPVVENSIGHFKVLNAYESAGPEHKMVCVEQCTYEFRDTPFGYLMTMYSSFRNLSKDFAFGDQEEMGLGIRLATALTVRHGNGTILNSNGGINEKGTWGKQAEWCAYSGVLNGQRTGVMIVPHPDNFRESWYHSRDYGLLVANPFGEKAMTAPRDRSVENDSTPVPKGEQITFGFSILLYGKEIDYDEAYQEILKTLKK